MKRRVAETGHEFRKRSRERYVIWSTAIVMTITLALLVVAILRGLSDGTEEIVCDESDESIVM